MEIDLVGNVCSHYVLAKLTVYPTDLVDPILERENGGTSKDKDLFSWRDVSILHVLQKSSPYIFLR